MRPYELVLANADRLQEVISYPYMEGEEEQVKVRDPGDPTTLKTMATKDLSPVVCVCPHDNFEFRASVDGEFLKANVVCPRCCRRYYAVYGRYVQGDGSARDESSEGLGFRQFECEPGMVLLCAGLGRGDPRS